MSSSFDLGSLAESTSFSGAIDVEGRDESSLIDMFSSMARIRVAERTVAKGREEGLVKGPVHLGVGQEAVAVGLSDSLRKDDMVFGAHRSHAHLLALGSDLHRFFAEILARATGLCGGFGGSMHLWDQSVGFYGAVPIVAGTVPLAVGAGLSSSIQDRDSIGLAYLGDGAVEEGVVHESLNLAKNCGARTMFCVENNLYASHLHISQRQPWSSTARFAAANGIDWMVVDGNDVLAVADAARGLVGACRKSGRPVFLEAVTYRWYGHVDWREDIDVGITRSREEVANWRSRDPLRRLDLGLQQAGIFSSNSAKKIFESHEAEAAECWSRALRDPHPSPSSLLSNVYN